jgi:hypothetical protein
MASRFQRYRNTPFSCRLPGKEFSRYLKRSIQEKGNCGNKTNKVMDEAAGA